MNLEKVIEELLQQVNIGPESHLTEQTKRYLKLTKLLQDLTDIQDELVNSITEKQASEAVEWLRNREKPVKQVEVESTKQTFIEMLDAIAQQNFIEDDRLGWLLTRVLSEYYCRTSGFNIQDWMYNVSGEQQLKFILLLMSQGIEFGEDEFPNVTFLINRYIEEQKRERD